MQLTKELTTALVLTLSNFSLPFMIECDALGKRIEAVLSQNKKVIAYFSKPLSETSLNKSIL